MGAEGGDGTAYRCHTFVGEQSGPVRVQRRHDDVEVGGDLAGRGVRVERRVWRRSGYVVEYQRGHGPQPGVDAPQCPAVRFVGAERRVVLGRIGQRLQGRTRGDQARRHRQLAGQVVDRVEVVVVCDAGLHLDGESQHVRGDERVAVAIATDPRAHRDHFGIRDRRIEPGGDELLDVALEAGDRLEDARPVVTECFVDLVAHPELRQAHLGGLPQRQHLDAEPVVDLIDLGGADGSVCSPCQEVGHVVDVVEHRLTSDLGRMGRDDGRHAQVVELVDDSVGGHAVVEHAVEAGAEAALLPARSAVAMEAPAALGVEVLGRVGEK